MDGQQTHGQMAVEKDYDILELLGEGAFAMVYKARHKKSDDIVAVKQIKLNVKSWTEACRSTELQALRALRHPFIVRLRELIRSQYDGGVFFIMEFIDSNLCNLVKGNPQGLEEQLAGDLTRQLFAGLAHMHQHNFFHRDIKPENLLLDTTSMSVRIADFGQARSLRAVPPFTDYVGTRWYRSPECLLRDRAYSSPVDVWAAGLVLAELLRGSPVFCGTSSLDQLYKIFQVLGQPDHEWPEFGKLAEAMRFRIPDVTPCGLERVLPRASPEAHQMVSEVLVLNPRLRPTARKCIDHSFFNKLPPLDIPTRASAANGMDGAPVSPRDVVRTDSSLKSKEACGSPGQIAEAPGNDFVGRGKSEAELGRPDLELDAELDKILGVSSDSPDRQAQARATNSDRQVQLMGQSQHPMGDAELDAILDEHLPDAGVRPGSTPQNLPPSGPTPDQLEKLLKEAP